jgi:hypothetical protein
MLKALLHIAGISAVVFVIIIAAGKLHPAPKDPAEIACPNSNGMGFEYKPGQWVCR